MDQRTSLKVRAEQAKPRDASDVVDLQQGREQIRSMRRFFTQFADDAGAEELSKPADASDVESLADAKAEISRLRCKFADAGASSGYGNCGILACVHSRLKIDGYTDCAESPLP